VKRHRVGRGAKRSVQPKLTSEILRDLRRQIVESDKPEPYAGHKEKLLRNLDENIAYFVESERQGRTSWSRAL